MQSELQRLLSEPLSQRSLHSITSAAIAAANASSSPLGYFVVASLAENLAARSEGAPVSADAASIRDELLRPALLAVVEAAETGDDQRLVSAANAAIKASLLSR